MDIAVNLDHLEIRILIVVTIRHVWVLSDRYLTLK
eukprot:gene4620-8587_t